MARLSSFTVRVYGLLGTVLASSALGMTRGMIKFLHPTLAPKNSGFSLSFEEKNGVLIMSD